MLVFGVSAYLAPKGLRELRNWATKVKADFVINIVQPGRFITIERGLTFHIRERRADGQLLGDLHRRPAGSERARNLPGRIWRDRRDRTGTFLVLMNGNVQRVETGRPDPTIVLFERYAFDLSRFTGGTQVTTFGVRERNLWEVAFPDPEDPVYKQQPTGFRAELHDRLVAPLYPIAFTVLCFAILGAPRTSRQSREMSLIMTVTLIGTLRLIGFACNVLASQNRHGVLCALRFAGIVAFAGGLYAIHRGAVLEPPAFLTQPIARLFERLSRRLQPSA